MSLKGFHILLISLSSLLALVFGGWSLSAHRQLHNPWHLAGALFSFAAAVGLVVYITWFARKIQTPEEEQRRRRNTRLPLVLFAAVWLLSSDPVPACSVCYGEAAGPMIDAARLGVYLLFGLVGALQVSFFLFFLHLRKRAREYRRNQLDPRLVES